MNRYFIVLAVLILWLSIVGAGRADVIYSQTTPSSPIGAYSSNDTATGQKIADNFVLDTLGSATIRSLRFIGGYVNRNPPPLTPPLDALPTDNFRVTFLRDSVGTPGLPISGGDFHVGLPVRRTPTDGELLNDVETPFEFVIDLGSGITLNPDTMYWMSIVNNPGPDSGWTWARAPGVIDQNVAATFGEILTGPWQVVTSGGMYFELNDMNVPEPASLCLLLAAACGLVSIRIRLRSIR